MDSESSTPAYDPLDLEIIDRVFEAAWARFVAAAYDRDPGHDEARMAALHKWVFALASHPVEFDSLLEEIDSIPVVLQESTESRPDAA